MLELAAVCAYTCCFYLYLLLFVLATACTCYCCCCCCCCLYLLLLVLAAAANCLCLLLVLLLLATADAAHDFKSTLNTYCEIVSKPCYCCAEVYLNSEFYPWCALCQTLKSRVARSSLCKCILAIATLRLYPKLINGILRSHVGWRSTFIFHKW